MGGASSTGGSVLTGGKVLSGVGGQIRAPFQLVGRAAGAAGTVIGSAGAILRAGEIIGMPMDFLDKSKEDEIEAQAKEEAAVDKGEETVRRSVKGREVRDLQRIYLTRGQPRDGATLGGYAPKLGG